LALRKMELSKVTHIKLRTSALAIAALAISATTGYAQDDDILSRYRDQGGLLPVETGTPPAGNVGNRAGASSEAPVRVMADPLSDGTEMSDLKIEGFNEAIDQAFPMTPEMIRKYRKILEANERAAQERPEPKEEISTTLVSLEPGEPAPLLTVSPSIASVIGFYDATGAAWPITQYVLGNTENFNAIHLGEDSNNIVLTPGSRIGFTNLVVVLEGQAKPVTVRVKIAETTADYRFDVQVMLLGPDAQANNASAGMTQTVTEAGDSMLLAAISGVDLPKSAKKVNVIGVDARGWVVDGELYLRSRHALLSPSWTGSMAGPDGIRVYKINPASVALFSVGGSIVRADIKLP
jgi:intracellular multiplication protein IcmK